MPEQQFDKDTWQTPKYFFNWLNKRFDFDIDGCANGDNALVKLYFGEGGLADDFLIFMHLKAVCLKRLFLSILRTLT
mgnify:CR=1 FL=1|nr:MAG TPA: DNA N-6-adenine-methyltransferase [Caudoviricetes sp.]